MLSTLSPTERCASGCRELAQLVKFMPQEPEDLSVIPRTHGRKLGAMECICDPITGEAAAEGPLGSLASQSSLVGKTSAPARDPISENKVDSDKGKKTTEVDLWPPYTHAHMYIHALIHT